MLQGSPSPMDTNNIIPKYHHCYRSDCSVCVHTVQYAFVLEPKFDKERILTTDSGHIHFCTQCSFCEIFEGEKINFANILNDSFWLIYKNISYIFKWFIWQKWKKIQKFKNLNPNFVWVTVCQHISRHIYYKRINSLLSPSLFKFLMCTWLLC